MGVRVVLRASCDVFVRQKGSSLKKRCGASGEWEAATITHCRWDAESAGWHFKTAGKKDQALCPDCGPAVVPYAYGKKA